MSVLDVFTIQYVADTAAAEADIDKLEKKAEALQRTMTIKFDTYGSDANAASFGDAVGKAAAEAFNKAAKVSVQQGQGQGQGGQPNRHPAAQRSPARPTGMGRHNPAAMGFHFADQIIGQIGFASSHIFRFARMFGALAPLFAVAATGAAALKIGIDAANKSVDDFKKLKLDAWAAGMSQTALIRQQVIGEHLHITNDVVSKSMKGLADKAREIAMIGATGAYVRSGQADVRLRNAWARIGVTPPSRSSVPSPTRMMQQVIFGLRNVAQQEGPEKALAIGTKHFGLELEYVNKVISASSSEIAKLTENLNAEVATRIKANEQAKILEIAQNDLLTAQNKLSREVALQTTPAMSRLLDEFNQVDSSGKSLATAMGELSASFIDFATQAVGGAKNLFKEFKMASQHPGELSSAAISKRIDDEIAAAVEARKKTHPDEGYISRRLGARSDVMAAHHVDSMALLRESIRQQVMGQMDTKDAMSAAQANKARTAKFLASFDFTSRASLYSYGATRPEMEAALRTMSAEGEKVEAGKESEYLRAILDEERKNNRTAEAQNKAAQDIKGLIFQMANVSLEQAMSMWASGVGRAGGMQAATDKAMQGTTRATYERTYKGLIYSLSGKPTAPLEDILTRSRPDAADAYKAINSQVERATAPSGSSSGGQTSITIEDININSSASDPAEAGRQMAAELQRNIVNIVYDHAGPAVS